MNDFDSAVVYVLQNEGGFVDRPNDKGGPTNFGITKETLYKFYATLTGSYISKDIQYISSDDAKAIYRKFFWDPLGLDQLPRAIATAIFDFSVNDGQSRAVKFAQSALGLLAVDGVLGPKTVEALKHTDAEVFILRFIGCIQDHYVDRCIQDNTQLEFLKGWLNRSLRLLLLIDASKP